MQLHVLLQRLALLWDQERDGRKVKQLWKGAAHAIVNHTKLLLAAKILKAWQSIVPHLFLHHHLDVSIHQAEAKPVQFAAHRDLCKTRLLNYELDCLQLKSTVGSIDSKSVFELVASEAFTFALAGAFAPRVFGRGRAVIILRVIF